MELENLDLPYDYLTDLIDYLIELYLIDSSIDSLIVVVDQLVGLSQIVFTESFTKDLKLS